MIRLAVNAMPLLSPFAGIASYIRNLMTALVGMTAIEPRYFYGFGWGDELLAVAPRALARGRGLVRRGVPLGWEASCLVRGATFAKRGGPGRFDLYPAPAFLF